MPMQWMLALQNGLLALVIPAAIIIGHRMRGGSLIVTGGAALLALVAFWLLGTTGALLAGNPFNGVALTYIFFGGVLLLLGAWALGLADAARERRWGWVALLSLAVYCTFVALLAALLSPYAACLFVPRQPYCASTTLGEQALFIASSFIGPVAIMLYAVRARAPKRDALPAGLSVSPLDSAQDTGPELR